MGGESLDLVAVRGEILTEVSVAVQQADGDERDSEIGGRLEMVAGEHSESAGILGQRLGQTELGREVGDQSEGAVRALLEPTSARYGVVEIGEAGVETGLDPRVVGEAGPPRRRELLEQPHRVVTTRLPQLVVERGEQGPTGLMPGPVQIRRQPAQADQRRWDGGLDVEVIGRAHDRGVY